MPSGDVSIPFGRVSVFKERRVVIIPFSSQAGNPIVSDEQVLQWFCTFMDGGTSFDAALSKAISEMRSSGLRNPDVVMITDGECQLSDSVAERFVRTGMRLFVLFFGGYTHALRRVAHKEIVATIDNASELILELVKGGTT